MNILRIYFQIPKTCGTNKGGVLILDSERLELLNEDAQVDLYLFILGILAAEEIAATAWNFPTNKKSRHLSDDNNIFNL